MFMSFNPTFPLLKYIKKKKKLDIQTDIKIIKMFISSNAMIIMK